MAYNRRAGGTRLYLSWHCTQMEDPLKQLSQTRSDNPFRPGSGILPPLLAGRDASRAGILTRAEASGALLLHADVLR